MHDQLFKELLQGFLPEVMRLFFPEQARRIDWSSLQFVNTELFSSGTQGSRRTVDLAARVRTLEGEAEELLVHVEIESDLRAGFPARMFEYYMLLRLRDRLPIFPVVITLRPGFGGITWGEHEELVLGQQIARFRYRLISLPDLSREGLDRSNPVVHALAPLLSGRPADPLDLLVESLLGISESETSESRRDQLTSFLHSYVPLSAEELEKLLQRLRVSGLEAELMTNPWKELGATYGMRESLRQILQSRFGSAPESLLGAIGRIHDQEALLRAIRTASTASSPEEVERELPSTGSLESARTPGSESE
ncbi:MAG: hypothetical protein ACK47B_14390 [Armatimonadota bacterium]